MNRRGFLQALLALPAAALGITLAGREGVIVSRVALESPMSRGLKEVFRPVYGRGTIAPLVQFERAHNKLLNEGWPFNMRLPPEYYDNLRHAYYAPDYVGASSVKFWKPRDTEPYPDRERLRADPRT